VPKNARPPSHGSVGTISKRGDEVFLVFGLDVQEREVLSLRFGLDGQERHTLAEIGSQLNVSRERVRQVELKACASCAISPAGCRWGAKAVTAA
jgi:hypothetical protein